MVSQDPNDLGWASAILYLSLGYLMYVSLRFALDPTEDERIALRPVAFG